MGFPWLDPVAMAPKRIPLLVNFCRPFMPISHELSGKAMAVLDSVDLIIC